MRAAGAAHTPPRASDPMDRYAFPDVGVPQYSFPLDRCIVYAIVRTESGFDQNDKSAAKAVGLMQVTPSRTRALDRRLMM